MDIDDYTRKYAHQYEGDEWFEQVMVEMRRHKVLETLRTRCPRSVLEVGCALDPIFSHWHDCSRYTIVEPSSMFVQAARALPTHGVDYEVLEGFVERCIEPLKRRGSFEVIIVSSLLHEVPDAKALLATIRELSSPNTVVHFNVPNVRSMHRLLALEMGVISDVFEKSQTERKFQRQTRYDRASFETELTDAGFRVLRSGTYFIKPFTHRQMEAIFDKGIVDRRALDGLGRLIQYMPDLGAEMFAEASIVPEFSGPG